MLKKIRISTILLTLLFTMFGCSEQFIYEPEISNELNKGIHPLIPNEISKTQTIEGNTGGTIVLNGLYRNTSGRVVTVNAILTIPKNAFQGTTDITISTDSIIAALSFTPAMQFDNALNLSLVFTNLDLNALDLTHDVKFVFMGDDGTIELTQNDGVQIQLSIGALQVKNAKIEHFSKYGYTR